MSDLSSRQVSRLLKRIGLRDHDIVLVKKSKFDEKEIMETLKLGVEFLKLDAVFVIIVDDFDDIKSLNKQEMNSHGWYHISDINKLTKVKRG